MSVCNDMNMDQQTILQYKTGPVDSLIELTSPEQSSFIGLIEELMEKVNNAVNWMHTMPILCLSCMVVSDYIKPRGKFGSVQSRNQPFWWSWTYGFFR